MKLFLMFILTSLISTMAFADHKEGHSHKEKPTMNVGVKTIDNKGALIKVQGMVCAFCAQGVEKNFNKQDEVKETKVDLDKMEVFIRFEKGKQLNEKEIEKIVTGAGYKYKGLKYEK